MQASAQDAIVAWRAWSWPGCGVMLPGKIAFGCSRRAPRVVAPMPASRGIMSVCRHECGADARM